MKGLSLQQQPAEAVAEPDAAPVAAPVLKAPPAASSGVGPVPGLAVPDADRLGGRPASTDVTQVLERRRGRGEPLPEATAAKLGAAFDSNLSDVRVHTDAEAAGVARQVEAQAFTYGSDVYFAPGRYAPGTDSGERLLAHELGHVVSEPGSGSGPTVIGRADDPAEARADAVAAQALAAAHRDPG